MSETDRQAGTQTRTNRQTGRHAQTDTQSDTNRHTHRQTGRHADAQTDIQTGTRPTFVLHTR